MAGRVETRGRALRAGYLSYLSRMVRIDLVSRRVPTRAESEQANLWRNRKANPFADIPSEMTAEWQLVDLAKGKRRDARFAEDGLDQLRIGIGDAGIDARYFEWPPENDPDRAPYRGLEPLEAEDAGIFFGRNGPTIVGLDLLRGLRETAPPRLVVILGASGAGKSSFLRAGLLPRLTRERQHFLPLPVIRPADYYSRHRSGGRTVPCGGRRGSANLPRPARPACHQRRPGADHNLHHPLRFL
jgi:hypothetical protein